MRPYERIVLLTGDITEREVGAIVNAANSSLQGGGGVDGAIHAAAGPELLEECRKLGGCKTGQAKVTHGFKLPAKYVIHTVGPVWHGGGHGEEELLENCYRNSLKQAEVMHVDTVAFPSISTGAYGYPIEKAARVAVATILSHLKGPSELDRVEIVLFSEKDRKVYEEALSKVV